MTPVTRQRPELSEAPPSWRWVAGAAFVVLGVLLLALVVGDGGTAGPVPGLSDPGGLVRWGLPVAKVVFDVAGVLTVGFAVLAVMLPAPGEELGRDSLVALRSVAIAAIVWAGAAVAVHVFTLADLLGVSLGEAVAGQSFMTYTQSIPQGQAYASVFILAMATVPAARLVISRGGAIGVLVLAVSTLIPPALAGHAGSGDYHVSAQVSLLVHAVAISLWVGGLVALSSYAARQGAQLPRLARTYSPLALGCFVLVGASGVANGWVRVSSLLDLLTTAYGWLLLGKAAILVVLGYLGAQHRARTLPALDAGRRGAFRRLAAGEIVVMAAAVGLAVALSRTQPPVPEDPGQVSIARSILNYPVPPEPNLWRLLTDVYPDATFGIGCLAALLLYAAGVRKLRRRGDHWPAGRTAAWVLGVGLIGFAQLSGLMTYGMTMLSVHMVQHLVLMMICPVLLVLGGPLTLALRAIAPAPRGEIGLRERLLTVTHSRPVRVLTHPLVALTLFVSGPFMVYFSGLFEAAMRDHYGHVLMSLHFLLTGYLFYEVLLGIDPLPRRPPYFARVGLQFAAVVFHAIFGVALMEATRLIGGDYYRQLATDIQWLPDVVADQRLAGSITWGFSEIPGLIVMGVLLYQWSRSDEREARRFDRREGDAEERRRAYNEYLARLDDHARARGE